MGEALKVSREQVLRYRFLVQELEREDSRSLGDVAVLDIGVQDTGPDGGGWALANRGVTAPDSADTPGEMFLAWTLRGAPHFYRRADAAAVAAATTPFSEADARKRIFDAAKPLREAGLGALEALVVVAAEMRKIADRPTAKGEMSSALTARLPQPYLRNCRPCNAVHTYEQPFRIAALQGGLELQPGTSPPVLQRIVGWEGPATIVPERLDVVRAYLHLLGPAAPESVAGYLDAPAKDVRARWPEDAVKVVLGKEARWILAEDRLVLASAEVRGDVLRLVSPYDLFLQARDRELLVPDADRRKRLWVALGRPGAVVWSGELVGTWRPRASGQRLRLAVALWAALPDGALTTQAERLASHRGLTFDGFTDR